MFSNRGFGWKLAAALAIVAGFGLLSAIRGEAIHPSLWRCLAQPARWDGAELWLSDAKVLRSDTEGFEIEFKGARARAIPAAGVAPGDTVSLVGTFRAQGSVIRTAKVQKSADGEAARRLSVGVSIAVLALVLLNFLRHFAFRPKVAQVEGLVPSEDPKSGRVEGPVPSEDTKSARVEGPVPSEEPKGGRVEGLD